MGCPGVIGYDPINEPWGRELGELAPLHEDAARVIRSVHPWSILFLEGHVTTNSGLQTRLPRPSFGNVAYSPHYYHPPTILVKRWAGMTASMNHAFAELAAKADEWEAPLFLSEFGAPADARGVGAYIDHLYQRLDAALASGAQWNYTPQWNPRDLDGWNGEDFNVLEPGGVPRANFRARPYPRKTAGTPLGFAERRDGPPGTAWMIDAAWDHRPELGETEIFVPREWAGASVDEVQGADVSLTGDAARQVLLVKSPSAGVVRIRITTAGGR